MNGQKSFRQNVLFQKLHEIGLALFAYANDNEQQYPDGASSTEVFQKLVDGGYISDLQVFYMPMNGKVEPHPAQKKLKPENVCFDVTGGVSANDTNNVPLVFLTGFKVTYAPGFPATPIGGQFPRLETTHGFLGFTWHSSAYDARFTPGIGAFYTNMSAMWIVAQGDAVPKFVPEEFDAQGKTYRQLTPEGVLR